jgi:hypothetical protein
MIRKPTTKRLALLCTCILGTACASAAEPELSDSDRVFLDTLEERTFDFFWETANAKNGLVPDRWPTPAPSSVAAVGFGLTAYCVGVERGYITRDEAIERIASTLKFFRDAPQSDRPENVAGFHGLYYHFIDMKSGHRSWQCELSSIDTALLMAGVLCCREYFDGGNPREREIRELADLLYGRVEWDWFQPRPPLICLSWHPERGFGQYDYGGYNETMLLYVLALGSPTHPIDPAAWEKYVSTYRWADFYDQEHVNFDPLFGHQYSHAWIDFRKIQDRYMREKGIDYFENSRRATYSQRAYAMKNPNGWRGYGANVWGLTACDGPADLLLPYAGGERQFHSYWARGVCDGITKDDGTIAPTAAGGSIPFAPEITIPALRAMRERYGDALFAKYGFVDSFNPSFTYQDVELKHGRIVDGKGWVNSDYLGIDQGPILLMIENYRSELVWKLMKKNAHIRRGLERAGFSGGWLENRR